MKNNEIRRFRKKGGFIKPSSITEVPDYIEILPNKQVFNIFKSGYRELNECIDLEFALDCVIAGEWEEVSLIRERVNKLNKQIEECNNQLKDIQKECKHQNIEKESHADTGNYDPSNDRDWTDFKCLDCDKQWTITKYLND